MRPCRLTAGLKLGHDFRREFPGIEHRIIEIADLGRVEVLQQPAEIQNVPVGGAFDNRGFETLDVPRVQLVPVFFSDRDATAALVRVRSTECGISRLAIRDCVLISRRVLMTAPFASIDDPCDGNYHQG